MNTKARIFGELDPFWETGTEGVLWSVRCPYLPSYDGDFILKNGDFLTVLNDDCSVLWAGKIKYEYRRNFVLFPNQKDFPGGGQQSVGNYWVHGLQKNLDPDTWADMFFARKQAMLITKPRINHPFLSHPDDLEQILTNMPFGRALQLYSSALYSWLSFSSDGSFRSYAQEWNFELEDIIKVLGNLRKDEIDRWKTYPKYPNDKLIDANLHTFTRVGLLYGIYGDLYFAFRTKEDRYNWLNDSSLINGNTSPKELLCSYHLKDIITVRKLTSSLLSFPSVVLID
jgi:hypothetical protein